jgi:hypothetical protein
MPRSRLALAVFVALAALVTACNIGPQPLPPGFETDPTDGRGGDAGASGAVNMGDDAGAVAPSASADAGAPMMDAGGFADSSDGGDAGDAGTDASADADVIDAGAIANDF